MRSSAMIAGEIQEKDNIPPALLSKLKVRHNTVTTSSPSVRESTPLGTNELELVQKALTESNVNHGQREKLCAALLLGDYDIMDNLPKSLQSPSSSVEALPPRLTKNLAHLKRHGHRHKFLELESNRAYLHPLSPAAIANKEILRRKSLQKKNLSYSWAGQALPIDPNASNQKTAASEESAAAERRRQQFEKQSCLSEAIRKAKLESIEKDARETREVKEIAVRRRNQKQEKITQKYIVHKKLSSFREKLKERLRERHDPEAGMIMRCINEDVVHSFLSRHKGYNMSVDAILAEVGSSLTASRNATNSSSNLSHVDEVFNDADAYFQPPRHIPVRKALQQKSKTVGGRDYSSRETSPIDEPEDMPFAGPSLKLRGARADGFLNRPDPRDINSKSLLSKSISTKSSEYGQQRTGSGTGERFTDDMSSVKSSRMQGKASSNTHLNRGVNNKEE